MCVKLCRSVVFNYRGCGNTRLSTPLLNCPGNVDDLMETVCHIKRRYPKSPVMAVGTSLGGYAFNQTSYICDWACENQPSECKIHVAITLWFCREYLIPH